MSGQSITCLTCNRTSHNPTDVRERYCGWCDKFLEDAPARPFTIQSTAAGSSISAASSAS